jgi:hypothetical protein
MARTGWKLRRGWRGEAESSGKEFWILSTELHVLTTSSAAQEAPGYEVLRSLADLQLPKNTPTTSCCRTKRTHSSEDAYPQPGTGMKRRNPTLKLRPNVNQRVWFRVGPTSRLLRRTKKNEESRHLIEQYLKSTRRLKGPASPNHV